MHWFVLQDLGEVVRPSSDFGQFLDDGVFRTNKDVTLKKAGD